MTIRLPMKRRIHHAALLLLLWPCVWFIVASSFQPVPPWKRQWRSSSSSSTSSRSIQTVIWGTHPGRQNVENDATKHDPKMDWLQDEFETNDQDDNNNNNENNNNKHHHNVKPPPVLGYVQSIESFTTSDGPGIRMILFLQGCPKRCIFCCNPETQGVVCHLKNNCNSKNNEDENEDEDDNNDNNIYTDLQIGEMLEQYRPFFQNDNGGITLSGGEAMMQPDFVKAVFQQAHDLDLTTCLDTACYGNTHKEWDYVLQHTDYVLLCLKGMDNDIAAQVAGTSPLIMAKSKEFARYIRDQYANQIQLTLRWVILKDITDTNEEIERLIAFAKELHPVFDHVELIPYHELGREKWDALNMLYPLDGMPPYDPEQAREIQRRLETAGIPATLSMV